MEHESDGPFEGEIVLSTDAPPRFPQGPDAHPGVVARVHPGVVARAYITPEERDRLAGAWLADAVSPNTEDGYRHDITEWFRWLDAGPAGEPLPFQAVRRLHVALYRRWLESEEHPVFRRRGKVLQPATVHRKLAAVSSFYDYAVEETEHVDVNPCAKVKRPEVSDDSMTAGLDAAEARALLAAAEASGNLRSSAIVRLLLQTGIRVSELCAANTGDLSYERGHRTVIVTRKGGKRQKLPIGPTAARALDAYLRGRRGPLFLQVRTPERIKRQHVWRLVRDLARSAGIEKPIHPHSLRHTAATLALEAGEPIHQVQDMLGHVSPKTTMRYNRARHGLDKSAVHALERVLGDAGPASPPGT